MFDLAKRLGLNRAFRTQEEAQARHGEIVSIDGEKFVCTSHNDLGCLYWTGPDGKEYVGGLLPR